MCSSFQLLHYSALFGSLYFLTFVRKVTSHCIHPFFSQVHYFLIITFISFFWQITYLLFNSSSEILTCTSFQNLFLCCLILPNSLCFYFSVLDRLVTFPNLGEEVLYRSSVAQQHTVLWSPDLYVLGDPLSTLLL